MERTPVIDFINTEYGEILDTLDGAVRFVEVQSGIYDIAILGERSTGKSSLIEALPPVALTGKCSVVLPKGSKLISYRLTQQEELNNRKNEVIMIVDKILNENWRLQTTGEEGKIEIKVQADTNDINNNKSVGHKYCEVVEQIRLFKSLSKKVFKQIGSKFYFEDRPDPLNYESVPCFLNCEYHYKGEREPTNSLLNSLRKSQRRLPREKSVTMNHVSCYKNTVRKISRYTHSVPGYEGYLEILSKNRSTGIQTQNIEHAKKLDFLVGNNAYRNNPDGLPELFNCVRDAQLMNTTLTQLGFQTMLLTDCTNDEIILAAKQFSWQINEKDIVCFYFSGHAGEQTKDDKEENYLFGVDSNFQSEGEKRVLQGVELSQDIIGKFNKKCIYQTIIDADRVFSSEDFLFKRAGSDSGGGQRSLSKTIQVPSIGDFKGCEQYHEVFMSETGKQKEIQWNGNLTESVCKNLNKHTIWSDDSIGVKNDEATVRQCCSIDACRSYYNLYPKNCQISQNMKPIDQQFQSIQAQIVVVS